MRPAAAASWSAGSAPGSGVSSVRVTMRIPPSAIFCLHGWPERHLDGLTYSTSSHEYASVRPAPATPPSQLPVPSLAWASRFSCRSGPPNEAAMTQSNGEGPPSCSVQTAVDMLAATASCGWPSERSQLHVLLGGAGRGKTRSGFPGESTCTWLHPRVTDVNVSHAATL